MIRINTFPGRMTSLVSQRGSNPKLSQALSSIDYVDQLLAAMDDLKRQAPAITFETSVDQVTHDIYDLVATGQGLPENLLDRYRQALTVEQVHDVVMRQLNDVGASLTGSLDSTVENGLDTVCTTLNTELQRVYVGLRELRAVPTEAADAITQGQVEQWQRKALLLAEYAQIRDAQRSVLTYGWAKLADEGFAALSKAWPIVGHASGLGAVWTDLPEWNKYGRTQDKDGRMRRLTPPWPDPNTIGFLDWLLEHPEANPWVPTLNQALELLTQITSRAQTFYDTTRGPDPDAVASEGAARRRMWSMPAHVVE